MISKQLLLGLSLILGGGVVLYAFNQDEPQAPQAQTASDDTTTVVADDGIARPSVEPLTISMEEESKLLDAKQRQREAQTLAQEREAKALLEQQEQAEKLALDKATAEQKILEPVTALTVETRPEAIAAAKAEAERERLAKIAKQKEREEKERAELAKQKEQSLAEKAKAEKAKQKEEQAKADKQEKQKADKAKADKTKTDKAEKAEKAKQKDEEKSQTAKNGQHKVVRGDGLIKLSRQYGVPVSAIAEANNMGRNDALPIGKVIKIPSKSQVAQLERSAKEKEAKKTAAANADKRLKEARQKDSDGDSKARYGVQVSLADNQAKADELVKQYRAAGYKVTTSQTSRGVRVLVGSEKNQEAAEALRDKIRNDSRVDGGGAWVKRTQ